MPTYTVDKPFWRKGLLQEVGAVISMTVAEAKYLAHVVTKAAVDAVSAAPKVDAASPAPQALGVAVAEDANGAAGN